MQLTIPSWDQLPHLTWGDKVAYLTSQFLTLPQIECPVEHRFEPGLYIREMRIPRDTLFIGRAHRHGHRCELIEGSIVMITAHGKQGREAPDHVHTKAGDHMVLYTLTDIVGRSIHPNLEESRDVDALELDAFEPVAVLRDYGIKVGERLQWQA